jgi:uncharacterized protein YlxP (DUF503 family)
MPEVIIKYKDSKTLKALKALSEYFNFTVATSSKNSKKNFFINGVSVIAGDSSVDMSEMDKIFSGNKVDAKQLRERAWQRSK